MPLVPASVRFYFDLRETAQAAYAQLPRSVRTALTRVLGVSVPAQWAAPRAIAALADLLGTERLTTPADRAGT
jgi:hypothetical protein